MHLTTLMNVKNIKMSIPRPVKYSITSNPKYSKVRLVKKVTKTSVLVCP